MAATKKSPPSDEKAPKGLARRRAARASFGDASAEPVPAKNPGASRPARRARKSVDPGTWLGIPLGPDRFAYARVAALRPPPANVATVVVHRTEGTRKAFDPDTAVTPALRIPPFLLLASWILERWAVLADPTGPFEPLPSEIDFSFAPGTPGVWRRAPARPPQTVGAILDPKEARGMVSASMHSADAREEQVRVAVENDASWSIGDPDPEMVRHVDRFLAERDG